MFVSFRACLLAGALLIASPALAEPITLGQALQQGAESSPRLTQAKAKVTSAEGRARQAGVSPNPELGVEVENFAGTGPYKGLSGPDVTLALSQRIELGGKKSARQSVAGAERDLAFLAFKQAEADLDRDIRVAHADLRAAEDRAVLARDNVGSAEELARTAGTLVDAGRDPPLRKMRADANLAEARAEQARTFGELLTARRLLASLIGSADPELSAVEQDSETAPAEFPLDATSLDEKVAEQELNAAQARIKLAKASGVPDVTASGGVRRFAGSNDTAFVAGFSIPLPFRDRNKGNIDAAESDSLAAEAGLAVTKLDASRARYDAKMLMGAAEVRLEALEGPGLKQAEEAYRLAKLGYNAGRFSLVELLDARNALNTSKLALIQARQDRARAVAGLIRANAQ